MRDILDIDAEGPATAVCVSQTLRIAFGGRESCDCEAGEAVMMRGKST